MTLNSQKLPILFEHKTNATFSGDDLVDAMLIKANGKPIQQIKSIFLHGRYPAISLFGKKYHIHRILAEHYMGRQLESCELVHHVNGVSWDAKKDNLQITTASLHNKYHLTGRILSSRERQVISDRNRKRKGERRKYKVAIPLHRIKQMLSDGMSVNAIANHFECAWSTIKKRTTDNPELLEKGN